MAVRREVLNGDDWIKFIVRDTGIGMAAEQVRNIFEEFAQADAFTARQYGGTGLGLAITRRFCQMLGGDITVTSKPTEGSTFTISLPATAPSSEPATLIGQKVGQSDKLNRS